MSSNELLPRFKAMCSSFNGVFRGERPLSRVQREKLFGCILHFTANFREVV